MEKQLDLAKRTRSFAVEIIRLVQTLPRDVTGDMIGRQLLRSATSVGADYREVCKARSTADFISKITIVEEEADESLYWLQLLSEARVVDTTQLLELIQEADELTAIFTTAGKTAKQGLRPKR